MRLIIDGTAREFYTGNGRNGFVDCHVYGVTLTGRRAVVAVHSVPVSIFNGGKAKTGGHVYQIERNPK